VSVIFRGGFYGRQKIKYDKKIIFFEKIGDNYIFDLLVSLFLFLNIFFLFWWFTFPKNRFPTERRSLTAALYTCILYIHVFYFALFLPFAFPLFSRFKPAI